MVRGEGTVAGCRTLDRRVSATRRASTALLSRKVVRTLVFLFLLAAAVFFLLPIGWVVSTSFKLPKEYFSFPPTWIPADPTFKHYVYTFTTAGVRYLLNSLVIGAANASIVLVLAVPATYAFERFRVGGQNLPFWILSQRMLPPAAIGIPFFLLFSAARLIDTYRALILAYIPANLAFTVWLLIGFFREFPAEIEEASLIDGCSHWGALIRVIVPAIAPGLAVGWLFSFVFAWNDFFFALILTREAAKTVTLQLSTYQAPTFPLWGEMSALATISILPIIVMVLMLQRYIVRGLAFGAVK